MPDSSGAVDLSATQQEEQPQAEETAEDQPTEMKEETAEPILMSFAVIVDLSGNPQVVAYEHPKFQPVVQPTEDLLFMAASTLVKDLQASETAQAAAQMTVGFLQQQAQQMQEQMVSAQLAQQLQKHPMGMKR